MTGAEKKRNLRRVEEIKEGKGKENRENEGGEEDGQKRKPGKWCRTYWEINISRVSSWKVFNLGVINSQL